MPVQKKKVSQPKKVKKVPLRNGNGQIKKWVLPSAVEDEAKIAENVVEKPTSDTTLKKEVSTKKIGPLTITTEKHTHVAATGFAERYNFLKVPVGAFEYRVSAPRWIDAAWKAIFDAVIEEGYDLKSAMPSNGYIFMVFEKDADSEPKK